MNSTIHFIVMIFFCTVTLVPAYAVQSDSLFCDGIVSVGATAGDVLRKCGQPAYATQREERIVEGSDGRDRVIITAIIDDWTFNFGPDRFQYRLILKNGRVVRIESLDYGY